ncbi:uncharacterized protein LOC128882641 [Hylaeus volcanicus]|uniref:uncharacterized protein LOC128882641 n=1 Tax=Hylaeus volcanicus TaxID=313075 RepID=UPI0023B86DDB|nr:uncharacterized protein LOC128882641 [Hylaeus volcanicus]
MAEKTPNNFQCSRFRENNFSHKSSGTYRHYTKSYNGEGHQHSNHKYAKFRKDFHKNGRKTSSTYRSQSSNHNHRTCFFNDFLTIAYNFRNNPTKHKTYSTCPICCSTMVFIAVGKCQDIVCWICYLKMRILGKSTTCPYCKIEQDYVLITENPMSQCASHSKEEKDHSQFKINPSMLSTINVENYTEDQQISQYKLLFDSKRVRDLVKAFMEYTCWHPLCTIYVFDGEFMSFKNSYEDWARHMISKHNLHPCSVCICKRQVFIPEQILYMLKDLQTHFTLGDQVDNTFILPHVQCKLCKEYSLDLEGYLQHSKEVHITCYICDKEATKGLECGIPPCFLSLNSLEKHYAKFHYICHLCDYLAFSTQSELSVHMLKIHRLNNFEFQHLPIQHDSFHASYQTQSPLSFTFSPYCALKFSKNESRSSSSFVSVKNSYEQSSYFHKNAPSDQNYTRPNQYMRNHKVNNEHTLNKKLDLIENDINDERIKDSEDEKRLQTYGSNEQAKEKFTVYNNLPYYHIPFYHKKTEESRRIFIQLHFPKQIYLFDDLRTLKTCLSYFFAFDTNLSLKNAEQWFSKLKNKTPPLEIFDTLWSHQENRNSQESSDTQLEPEPPLWRQSWRKLYPSVSPATEIFLRLLVSYSNDDIKEQVKMDILKLLPVEWLYELQASLSLPQTLIKSVINLQTDVTCFTELEDMKQNQSASKKKESSLQNSATETLEPVNVYSTISFLDAMKKALTLYRNSHGPPCHFNQTGSSSTLHKTIMQKLQHATKKELLQMSGLSVHFSANDLRPSIAENLISLCATYFLLAKKKTSHEAESRNWISRCFGLLETLLPKEFAFLELYVDESLKQLCNTEHNENYPSLDKNEMTTHHPSSSQSKLNYKKECDALSSHFNVSNTMDLFPPLVPLQPNVKKSPSLLDYKSLMQNKEDRPVTQAPKHVHKNKFNTLKTVNKEKQVHTSQLQQYSVNFPSL